MNVFAKLLLAFGLMLIIISMLLNGINLPSSTESIMGWMNVGLGVLMVFSGAAYLACQKKNQRKKHEKEDARNK